MGPWITLPAIIPEFDLDNMETRRTLYPVSISGQASTIVECASAWVLMIKMSVLAEKELWYRTASLLLVANRIFTCALVERDNIWWLVCRYANEEPNHTAELKIDLQVSLALYLGIYLSGMLLKDSERRQRPVRNNEKFQYFGGIV